MCPFVFPPLLLRNLELREAHALNVNVSHQSPPKISEPTLVVIILSFKSLTSGSISD